MSTTSGSDRPLIDALLSGFSSIEDDRKPCKVRYSLAEILFLVFTSSLCDIKSYDGIAEFGLIKLSWLQLYLPYQNGIPSHDTLNRIMSSVNTDLLCEILSNIFSNKLSLQNDKIIHIDGKRLRGSATATEQRTKIIDGGKQAAATLNVYSNALRQCLASVGIDLTKGGEQGAIETVLQYISVKGCLISLDAGFCSTAVVDQIVENEADYFIRVKDNQPKLLAAMSEVFANDTATDEQQGEEISSHGRIEKRDCEVIALADIDDGLKEKFQGIFGKWQKLSCLVKVMRSRVEKHTQKTSKEAAYFIVSQQLSAEKANFIARNHWSIENNLHWRLDVILGEDADRKRTDNAALNMSVMRKIVFNIHVPNIAKNKSSLKREINKCAISDNYRTEILNYT